MYQSHFHLQDRPFSSAANPEHYFPAASVEQARESIARNVERLASVTMVTGPVGCGKTLLCQLIANQYAGELPVCLVAGENLDTQEELLQAILHGLGLPFHGQEEAELRLNLCNHVTSPGCVRGVLLIIDDADRLSKVLLEEVRSITNLVRDGQSRARVLLVGSSRLDENLAHTDLESLNQRIAGRLYLDNFGSQETADYVRARIAACGGDAPTLFTDDALATVYRATTGVPRLINQICDHALLLGSINSADQVTGRLVEEAWADLQQLPIPHVVSQPEEFEAESETVIEFGVLEDTNEDNELIEIEQTLADLGYEASQATRQHKMERQIEFESEHYDIKAARSNPSYPSSPSQEDGDEYAFHDAPEVVFEHDTVGDDEGTGQDEVENLESESKVFFEDGGTLASDSSGPSDGTDTSATTEACFTFGDDVAAEDTSSIAMGSSTTEFAFEVNADFDDDPDASSSLAAFAFEDQTPGEQQVDEPFGEEAWQDDEAVATDEPAESASSVADEYAAEQEVGDAADDEVAFDAAGLRIFAGDDENTPEATAEPTHAGEVTESSDSWEDEQPAGWNVEDFAAQIDDAKSEQAILLSPEAAQFAESLAETDESDSDPESSLAEETYDHDTHEHDESLVAATPGPVNNPFQESFGEEEVVLQTFASPSTLLRDAYDPVTTAYSQQLAVQLSEAHPGLRMHAATDLIETQDVDADEFQPLSAFLVATEPGTEDSCVESSSASETATLEVEYDEPREAAELSGKDDPVMPEPFDCALAGLPVDEAEPARRDADDERLTAVDSGWESEQAENGSTEPESASEPLDDSPAATALAEDGEACELDSKVLASDTHGQAQDALPECDETVCVEADVAFDMSHDVAEVDHAEETELDGTAAVATEDVVSDDAATNDVVVNDAEAEVAAPEASTEEAEHAFSVEPAVDEEFDSETVADEADFSSTSEAVPPGPDADVAVIATIGTQHETARVPKRKKRRFRSLFSTIRGKKTPGGS